MDNQGGVAPVKKRILLALAAVAVAVCLVFAGAAWKHGPAAPAATVRHAAPQVTTPSPPAPVSTSPTLTNQCQAGYESASGTSSTVSYSFEVGQIPLGNDQEIGGTLYPDIPAYQVTLTNSGSVTAAVNGFVVVLSDEGGSEIGSDQVGPWGTPQYLTPGQSLSWVQYSSSAYGNAPGTYGIEGNQDASVPADIPTDGGMVSCQFLEWTQP
ncbi:MAG: hypothetical protein WA708_13875 [Acidobacteriaceae bacterium]